MFLNLLFYAIYRKIEKSGENTFLVVNTCLLLSFVLLTNCMTLLLILEFVGIDLLSKLNSKLALAIFAISTTVLSTSFLVNSRYEKVLNHYSKTEANIERYSVGYYFLSVLLLVVGALIKAQVS